MRAGGYGFRQPNPEIRFTRVATVTLACRRQGFRERVSRNFSNTKAPWCGVLEDSQSHILYRPENIQWPVAVMAFRTFLRGR